MWNGVIELFTDALENRMPIYSEGLGNIKRTIIDKLFEGEYFDELESGCFMCGWFNGCSECILERKCLKESTPSSWALLTNMLDEHDNNEVPVLQRGIMLATNIRDLEN